MFDLGSYFTSSEFLVQLAALISTVLSTFFGAFLTNLFGGTSA